MEHVFEILKQRPTLTIVLVFLLVVLLIIILRKQIIDWAKKRYDLYSMKEIKEAMKTTDDITEGLKATNLYLEVFINTLKTRNHGNK